VQREAMGTANQRGTRLRAVGETVSETLTANRPKPPNRLARAGIAVGRSRPLLLLVLILGLSAYMAVVYPVSFPTSSNIAAVLLDAAQAGILVVGMTVLMIGGAFDLSIGGVLALTGVVAGVLAKDFGVAAPLALLAGVLLGSFCGLANGLIVTRLGINALIATLATVGIFRGITQLISGTGVNSIGNEFAKLGQSVFLGLQSPFWVMLIVVVAGAFGVSRVRFFRQFYYVGGNAQAATLSGIKVDRVMLLGFILMGTLAGLAGVVSASRLDAAVVTAGTGVELKVITATVLGGASLKGGEGTVVGGFLGVLFIAIVQNALIISHVSVFWQGIVIGVVLLVAVSVDLLARRGR